MIKKTLIITFLLWHTFAITVYAMPREANNTFSVNVRSLFLSIVNPYIRTTMQWQQWNLFAPDPTQTYFHYSIQIQDGTEWLTVDNTGYLDRSNGRYAKLLQHLFDGYIENADQVSATLLSTICDQKNIDINTSIRIIAEKYMINNQKNPIDTQQFTFTCS